MKLFNYITFIVLLQGCFPKFQSTEDDRLFLKEIKSDSIHMKWFFYSTISSATPDYITIEKNETIDTICISSNISDIKISGNVITIGFFGRPHRYGKLIQIPKDVMGYQVMVDSSYIMNQPSARSYYKK